MNRQTVEDAAERIFESRRRGQTLDILPLSSRPATIADAYDVQEALHRKQVQDGHSRLAGWKVGCTNKVLQDLLNIPYPAAGGILAENVHRSGANLPFGLFACVGIECEIAFELGEDLNKFFAFGSASCRHDVFHHTPTGLASKTEIFIRK